MLTKNIIKLLTKTPDLNSTQMHEILNGSKITLSTTLNGMYKQGRLTREKASKAVAHAVSRGPQTVYIYRVKSADPVVETYND